ncbi:MULTISPECIES: ParA family partition ATPase [Gemmobacter]|jgi:chromosome partitioning protein|uniref:Chromosome partitioning protein n=2 Tax=Gemmobacter TaxID=204456 RepID=A0A2T6B4U7_9RHOB|nr:MULTISPECIES: ParA family partition ATPase [Gemmobacter]OJY31935.1 MAG: cobyrinic acid a,c-diamide synthase [Rhodobacterales bacterium 65-51]PTX51065.1 chromosome partitioning protein [Gemmobacter caeni]TWJ01065.1 chromosome partitioning protein [Gemmobacter caeni]GHC18562.1 cobyrinic acid a,c-diamide synthase [Gemmobacter nanjingensis]
MGKVITVAQQKGGAGKTTLAANLAVCLVRQGLDVALVDSDPQGSLGRWFMTRLDRLGEPDMDFSTASAWGVGYECKKLRAHHDVVIVDTPPKVDSDLRPALREADLVLVPVAASHVDLWATDGVLDLVARESGRALIVLNRMNTGTRLAEDVARAAEGVARVAKSRLAARVAFAETLGQGLGVAEGRGAAAAEARALMAEVLDELDLGAET